MFVLVSSELQASSRAKWRHLLSDVVTTCFQVADVVLPIVSHSSPEGNIPDDVSFVTTEWPGQLCIYCTLCVIKHITSLFLTLSLTFLD